ncbi:trithorax group protein osa-like [Copidosoma floridanum]|uniref:trithorax group protein osa-like n=1 Tax=Copidosoma floridanum TaxID=29053 RepID=UPI0006C93DB7|nr:trithorax group protein osa-like [Copidosoma floridanum]
MSLQQGNYQNSGSFQNYSPDQYSRPQGSVINQQNEYSQSYTPRTHYPPYVSDIDRNYTGNNLAQNNPSQDIYSRYSGNQSAVIYSSSTTSNPRNAYPTVSQSHSNSGQQPNASHLMTSQNQPSTGLTYSCSQEYYRQEQASYGSSLGNSSFTSSTTNKTMPPPSGTQQPRRHPDFVKEQSFSTYSQRSTFSGWPANTSQYGNTNVVRMTYSNQQLQPSQHQQTQPTQISVSASISSTTSSNNNHQWNNQQNPRTNSQTSVNTLLHTSSPWDQRYNQTSSIYASSGSSQNQLGISSALNQQSIIKREMTFPPDSIEGITPLSYKRRKLARTDIAPVEAWRIMMALRSGLLAESCWALDILNILLFDDSSIQYFGLAHLPGLLDILLEHFSRSLSDMFDSSLVNEDCSYRQLSIKNSNIDLGAIITPIDPDDRIKLLSSSNYTFISRRGKSVKYIPRDDDIFVLDNRRSWDQQQKETEVEPWHIDCDAINYIVTCFESEISTGPFTSHFGTEQLLVLQKDLNYNYSKGNIQSHQSEKFHDSIEEKRIEISLAKQKESLTDTKQYYQDKRKKLKTLSDVLSRIKKEPIEMNDLTREIFEKKHDNLRKDFGSGVKHSNDFADQLNSEALKSRKNTYDQNHMQTTSIFKKDLEEEVVEKEEREEEIEEVYEYGEDENTQIGNEFEKIEKLESKNKQSKHETYETSTLIKDQLKLRVRDPAGTLKRKKITDYEDESYSRDEASLHLITETQDNLARRCVCLSTILRNLTFIPGNELEFTRNITFLSLLGKLLLLHHEHPTRTQRTRNYDREEDADFAESCSSLQGENEWWWDFLYHIRENILVMAANIAGYMDLSQYPEEISRPILDGLLHWSVCPAAHGQDPFPTVNLNSSLSPQRLALEALCKLCVTESNVDLVVATPPYSRIQKLCSVLSRLLCRSEEQVLREFGVNLLHFLSAADSGIARTIALQTPCVALLVAFIEQAENSALTVANQHGIAALRDNPELMGTSLDMLRRAAGTLLNLSRHPDNRTLLLHHESRLLALVMSQILDQQVAAIVARVLFQCSRGAS